MTVCTVLTNFGHLILYVIKFRKNQISRVVKQLGWGKRNVLKKRRNRLLTKLESNLKFANSK